MEWTDAPRTLRVHRRRIEQAFEQVRLLVGPEAAEALDAFRHELDRSWPIQQQTVAGRDLLSAALVDSLTPRHVDPANGVAVGSCYDPGNTHVGGDFYDVFSLSDTEVALTLGDVRGKGARAAGTALMARHTLRTAMHLGHAPSAAFRVAHDLLLADGRDEAEPRFCTAVAAQAHLGADGALIHLALAGHPPALVLRTDGSVEQVGEAGTALGLFQSLDTSEVVVELGLGEVFLAFSDGVTEARNGADIFGDDRLADVLATCRSMAPQALVDAIHRAVLDYRTGDSHDDVTLVALAYHP
jgi:phosphoserine phosphatase RsbU/P